VIVVIEAARLVKRGAEYVHIAVVIVIDPGHGF
jgi:hypothetical protein